MTDLATADATAQAELVRRGDATPLELVDAAIARIEKLNGELNAVVHERFDDARARARSELPDGPFRGVPILFKDLRAAVEGWPYHEGMRFLKDAGWCADHTDDVAQRFLDAGFVPLGRANTPEQGLVPTTEPVACGATRNPWDTTCTPGGSSGGPAVAVASGMVPVAHANDGGGSIRIPASCCGLVGLKPSRGRSSRGPRSSPIDDLLNVDLCVSRTVRDTAGVLDALRGPGLGDSVAAPPPARDYTREVGADPGRLRVALLTTNPLGTGEIHPDCVAAAEHTATLLESLGHTVDRPELPPQLADEALVGHFTTLWTCTLARDLAYWEQKVGKAIGPDDVEPLTWTLAEIGRATPAPQYVEAQHAAFDLGRALDAFHRSGWDLILTPTLGEPPVPLGTFDSPDEPILGFARAAAFVPYTPLTNITGQPAISLPLFWNAGGLPIGTQLVARTGGEDVLLRVAAQLESAQPWADRRPPVHA
jgi:amidase